MVEIKLVLNYRLAPAGSMTARKTPPGSASRFIRFLKRAELELSECQDEHDDTQVTNDKYLHRPALDLISPD